jgi:hypothetical protein
MLTTTVKLLVVGASGRDGLRGRLFLCWLQYRAGLVIGKIESFPQKVNLGLDPATHRQRALLSRPIL